MGRRKQYSKKGETTKEESTKKDETIGVSQELNKKLRMEEQSLPSEDENDANTEDGSLEENCRSSQSTTAKRGETQMHCLPMIRAQGIKQDVIFNEHGQPVAGASPQMQSYIRVLVREKVNITYDSCRSVPLLVKECIWESVNLYFNVDPNWKMGHKEKNNKIADLKTSICMAYLEKGTDDLQGKIPSYYVKIWIPIKLLCGLKLEKKLVAKVDGKALADKLIEISEVISMEKEGLLKDSEDNILESVLGKPEHSGRLRGVGSDVTPTIYYKVGRGKDSYSEIYQRQQQDLMAQNE